MRLAVMLGMVLVTIGVRAAGPSFNPSPWVADLDQVHHTFSTKYANLEWAVFQREADLPALFADTQARIERASSDAEAQAAFDRLANKLGDEHVEFVWPKHGVASQPESVDRCTALGYDQRSRAKPLVSFVPGYRAISTPQSDEFPIGSLHVGKDAVGVIQIGVFEPQGFPTLCQLALHALSIPPNKACDDACNDQVDSWVSDRLTRDFASQLRSLKSAGAKVLLVDIAGNGGGTEWAEAVARMLTPIRLRSESLHFMRGDHWAKIFSDNERELIGYEQRASPPDRKILASLAAQTEERRREALVPCEATALWRGEHPSCEWLPKGFYASGFLYAADPHQLRGKPWAKLLFTPMEFLYEEGVWRGPLIVVIDRDVASAASEFAAVLQDNRAAILVGEPSGGGCGHTNSGTLTVLTNSKAVLKIPDCARFRADGTNEVEGIEPDVLVGFAATDGPRLRGVRLLSVLSAATDRARHLFGQMK